MSAGPLHRVIHHLRHTVMVNDGAGLTDSQLLGRFLDGRDEHAFEALVRRHGPMVLGVCRRIVGNVHDAEDAFQATFLVLVCKAATIKPREMVGNWLHGVAHTTSRRLRVSAAKRRGRETQVMTMPEHEAERPSAWDDLLPLLDRELSHLSDKYRAPVILCDLEGKTHKEAARQLGWPQGTLAGRLARARTMLARRLARHGLVLSGGALSLALAESAASACVPTALRATTVRVGIALCTSQTQVAGIISAKVAALTQGVLKTMFLKKLKVTIGVFLFLAALTFGGVLTRDLVAADQANEKQDKAHASPDLPVEKPKVADNTKEEPVQMEVTADGAGVLVEISGPGAQLRARASKIRYEPAKKMLILEGKDPDGVQLWRKRGDEQPDVFKAPRILILWADNKVRVSCDGGGKGNVEVSSEFTLSDLQFWLRLFTTGQTPAP